ncbi:MAG: Mut7-C RNAse domain-containing protein, partial [Candidatus Hodarchaeota archaeon]
KAQKRGLKAQQIMGIFLLDQLREVIQRWNLAKEIIPDFSRCPACNGTVIGVKKGCIRGEIPEGTLKHHNEFWKCENCGKIYWKGAHWANIKQVEQLLKQNEIHH